jgi:hypothetical protein
MGQVNVDGGRLEMETDAVRAGADGLREAGDAFAAGLEKIKDEMRRTEPGIGTNSGAADFLANYRASAPGMMLSAGNVDKTFKGFGSSAVEAAADYERTDREQQEAIHRTARG